MGYSARYHAVSLAAVFLALAVGILLGSQFGGELLNSTRKDLEKSLTGDLDATRAENKALEQRTGWLDSFGRTVYPLLVDSRLAGRQFGLVGLGDLPPDVTDAVEQAIEPTGGRLVAAGALRRFDHHSDLDDALAGTGAGPIAAGERGVSRFGRVFGQQLVTGGKVLDRSTAAMMSQSSGNFGRLDGLIVYHDGGQDETGRQGRLDDRLDAALLAGATGTGARVVGVETFGTDPSGIGFLRDRNLTTVDNVDMASGKVSLVYSLNGAAGDFGVKSGAGRLVPELLAPVPGAPEPPKRTRKQG